MQTLANVLDKPIKVVASDQAPALGAAIYAAVAAGIYPTVMKASEIMGSDYEAEYNPERKSISQYEKMMASYSELGAFMETVKQKFTDHEFQV
jgi:L-ribulokinase